MSTTDRRTPPSRDPVLLQVGEACIRLMAGAVPGRTLQSLKGELLSHPEAYPWREINEAIVADPVDDAALVQQALRAQRDWILRAGRSQPRKTIRHRGKSLAAYLLSRVIFFAMYSVAAVVLLLLLKAKWPAVDIYAILDRLRELAPGLFGGR